MKVGVRSLEQKQINVNHSYLRATTDTVYHYSEYIWMNAHAIREKKTNKFPQPLLHLKPHVSNRLPHEFIIVINVWSVKGQNQKRWGLTALIFFCNKDEGAKYGGILFLLIFLYIFDSNLTGVTFYKHINYPPE